MMMTIIPHKLFKEKNQMMGQRKFLNPCMDGAWIQHTRSSQGPANGPPDVCKSTSVFSAWFMQ